MNNKQHLDPSQVVLDLVFRWSETIGKTGTAKVVYSPSTHPSGFSATLLLFATNHRNEYVSLSLPVNFDGAPSSEDPPRWVLYRLGPGVWKLSPSVLDRQLHSYVTIIDVPELAPPTV